MYQTKSNPQQQQQQHDDDDNHHHMQKSTTNNATTTATTPGNSISNHEIPGSKAFADCEHAAISDLFYNFAQEDKDGRGYLLSLKGCRDLLYSIGERPEEETLKRMFQEWDLDKSGKLDLHEFLVASDRILNDSPARIVLVVGGPGSGKGILCSRLAKECNVVHLSSGELLRNEVLRGTPLGKECAEIMRRGELVSSAVITTLIRRHMRDYPGRRVLLDGFPRSLENAQDFLQLMGRPELALHLDCDDTILMERIMKRGKMAKADGQKSRSDDNFETALRRLRTFHKSHKQTMDWLRDQHIPIVNLDCSGTPENVWNQLLAIGRLMRPMATPKGADGMVLMDKANGLDTLSEIHDEEAENENDEPSQNVP
jgi:adenylate kinase family enzyme